MVRRVVGPSMLPTFVAGTLVVALAHPRQITEGDIIIFRFDGREQVKRVKAVEAERLFVIGDNPDSSTDSRTYGWLPRQAVLGKVCWPHPALVKP